MAWTLRCLAPLAAGAVLATGLGAAAQAGSQHTAHVVAAAGPPPVIVEETAGQHIERTVLVP